MLRIMSNNQWACDKNLPAWEAKGEDCSAEHREKEFAKIYAELLPDAIGFQEVSPTMLDRLMRELQALGVRYAALWGRDTPILYRPDTLELIDSEFGIYPAECPGFDGCFNNYDTKSWNIAVFREKQTGKPWIFATTHLWWMIDDRPLMPYEQYQAGSTEARIYQLGILMERVELYRAKYQAPAVLVGDLNCPYESRPIASAFAAGYRHANDIARDYAYPYHGYHWCGGDGYEPYVPQPFKEAIDHILIKGDLTVLRMDRYIDESYLPLSDHFPAYIDAEL